MTPPPAHLHVDILDWWHVGTGQGIGGYVDAAVARDTTSGLPILPGKTLRGLVREAVATAEDVGRVTTGFTRWLFGSALPPAAAMQTVGKDDWTNVRRDRFATKPGAALIGNAELPAAWRDWAASDPSARGVVDALFDTVASTAIDKDGIVAEHTLRRIEVAAPMGLDAALTWRPDAEAAPVDDVLAELGVALPLLRELGKARHRGLGRCRVTVHANTEVAA
jgi:hypothetical protein